LVGGFKKVSASGYLEERLKTLRMKLSPLKKAHKKHVFRQLIADNNPTGEEMEGKLITSVLSRPQGFGREIELGGGTPA
jgi:hypothetical protein